MPDSSCQYSSPMIQEQISILQYQKENLRAWAMAWVEITKGGSKWDHPEVVRLTEKVPALIASTSRVQPHSQIIYQQQRLTLGEAEKVTKILGKEEMEERLAQRPLQEKESVVKTQLFQDTDSGELYWRQQTDDFLGVRHEGTCPITWNRKLPKTRAKLQYITEICQGRLPLILENTSGPNTDISAYKELISRVKKGNMAPQAKGHKANSNIQPTSVPAIELKQV